MGKRWIRVGAAGLAALAVAGCGGGGPSRDDFESDVQDARNDVDSALEYITQAESRENLLARMDEAALSIDRAADDLEEAGAAEGLEDEADALVRAFHQLSIDLAATADQIRQPDFGDILQGTQGLSFESWDQANRVLGQLRQQGIDVAPLERH